MTVKLLCLKNNPHCKKGTWFIAEADGEPLFQARALYDRKSMRLVQTSRIGIPWDSLAEFCIEPGFQVPQSIVNAKNPRQVREALTAHAKTLEIEAFQHSAEDIIVPEVERRGRALNPTPRERSADVRRGQYQKPDLEDPDG